VETPFPEEENCTGEENDRVNKISANIALKFHKSSRIAKKVKLAKTSGYSPFDLMVETPVKIRPNNFLMTEAKFIGQAIHGAFSVKEKPLKTPMSNLLNEPEIPPPPPPPPPEDPKAEEKQAISRAFTMTAARIVAAASKSTGNNLKVSTIPSWICTDNVARNLLWKYQNTINEIKAENMKRNKEITIKTKPVLVRPFSLTSLKISTSANTTPISLPKIPQTQAQLKLLGCISETAERLMKAQKTRSNTGMFNETMINALESSKKLAQWSMLKHNEMNVKSQFRKKKSHGEKLNLLKISSIKKWY